MSYNIFMEPITISGDNLKRFGYLQETQRVDKLVEVLEKNGFHADQSYPGIEIHWLGNIPEFGENAGTSGIIQRLVLLGKITGNAIDQTTVTVTDENGSQITHNFH